LNFGQDGKAFRAQLVVPEQRQLYDYWLAKAGQARMPRRSDIVPGDIPRMLPGISLVEVRESICQSKLRLAGTRLREIYDREVTGLTLDDLEWGDKRDYWLAAFERTITEGLPTQGVVRGPRLHKEHMVQYWLRLPLRTGGDGVGMVLCFDYFMSAADRLDEDIAAIA
jgi:PAS domain